jgi:hypothetical protein
MTFILGSDGLHQKIKKGKTETKSKQIVKCPIFSPSIVLHLAHMAL